MNQHLGRLFLTCACCLAVASAARAQPASELIPFGDDAPRPSHRPLGVAVGDLSQAESLLAHRLHRTHNVQELQDLLTPFQDNPGLLKQLAGLKFKPDDLKNLEDVVKNNPSLLEDPKLGDLLGQMDKLRHGETLDADKRKELEDLAKDFFEQHKAELPSLTGKNPLNGLPPDWTRPPPHDSAPPKVSPPSSAAPPPNWLSRDIVNGMANVLKEIDRSPEGERLRQDLLHDLAKSGSSPSGSSTGLTDFMKSILSSEDVAWLAHNLQPPPMPNLGNDWSVQPILSAAPSGGGDSGGLLDGAVWVVALALIGVAAWAAFAVARRQAANAKANGWTPGPWPVHPSRVSTRADLIRAFEHLAYLCLGRVARSLNHLDVAARLGHTGADRAEAAGRLAHLYERARYAPPGENLPPNELTAARVDLAALAGAAA